MRGGGIKNSGIFYISKGSVGEVRSMLYAAMDLEYIDRETFNELRDKSLEVARMLSGLIKTL